MSVCKRNYYKILKHITLYTHVNTCTDKIAHIYIINTLYYHLDFYGSKQIEQLSSPDRRCSRLLRSCYSSDP